MKKFKFLIYYFFLFNNLNLYADNHVYEIKAKVINYEKNKNTIIAIGDAEAKSRDDKQIYSDKIIYNKDLDLISTEGNSRFFQGKKISISANIFEYNIKLRTIFASKNVVIEFNGEKYEFNDFKYYEQNQSGSGNKFKGKLRDGSTVLAESAELSQQSGIKTLTKAKYTSCKQPYDKNNQFCPAWSAISSSATHDKETQTITFKNTFLNLKNIPVMYIPYLSIPDPTVKRQSGFLSPTFQNLSNIGTTFKVPYFFAISDDRDLTITPVFYSKENNIYMANYRQKFKNSYFEIDTSFTQGYDNTDEAAGKTAGSRSHLFANYNGNFKDILFNDTEIKLKLQNVNNSTYLLVNQINTSLVKYDLRNLENSIEINSYGNRESLSFKTSTLQNLDATTKNQYEYILPQVVYSTYKNTENHQISFSSSFLAKNFSTNQTQENFTNTISTNSNQYIFKSNGIGSILKTSFTNINLNNDNVTGQKQDLFSDNYFTLALDNSYPLYKKNNDTNTSQEITPRVFIKYTTGSMANLQSNKKILNYIDVYSMNRMNDNANPETGFSLGLGFDWGLTKKDVNNENILKSNFSLGQIYKDSKNINMPTSSSLQDTSSDIVGSYNLNFYGEKNIFENINKIKGLPDYSRNSIGLKYEFNIDNNLSAINRNLFSLNTIYKTNYFSTSFEEKNNYIGNYRSVILNFKKLLFDTYILEAETKKNLTYDYTEYSNIGIFKEDDCIKFGIGFGRQDYTNQDLKPNRSLFFTITLKPFGEAGKADLSSFVK